MSVKNIFLLALILSIMNLDANSQSSAKDVRGAAAIIPLASEPPAVLVVDQPEGISLIEGRVVIQYRTENVRIAPVYGKAALQVSPRLGHLHITVDEAPWRWIDASNEPIIINGLTEGAHQVRIELVDPTHKPIVKKTVYFTIPILMKNLPSHH